MEAKIVRRNESAEETIEVRSITVTIDGNEYRIEEDRVQKRLQVTKVFVGNEDTAVTIHPRYSNQVELK